MPNYLTDAWYCAGWSEEISSKPLGRQILDRDIVLFRKRNGTPIALLDRCPHRFAPLKEGTVVGDTIACRYHGLAFGEGGACVLNPHDPGLTTGIAVDSFACHEKDGIVWIWMGPGAPDLGSIPDFAFHSDERWKTVFGSCHIAGNYQLIGDNLLDLSHTQFLHGFLKREGTARQIIRIIETERELTSNNAINSTSPSNFVRLLWPSCPGKVRMEGFMRWHAPSSFKQSINAFEIDQRVAGVSILAAHLVTPESPSTSHYFWSLARNMVTDDPTLDASIAQTVDQIFSNEDGWMISLVQQAMGEDNDLLQIRPKPVILSVDRAAIRVRLKLRRMISESRREASIDDALGMGTDP